MLTTGTFTAVLTDGSHVTIRLVAKSPSFATDLPADTLVAQYLSGPDNTRDYTSYAFVLPSSTGTSNVRVEQRPSNVRVWQRYRANERLVTALHAILGDPLAAAVAYARESGRCAICDRLLTEPKSLAAGIGPTCREKL